tara:strand:- start:1 stop:336 length:336 start_codon:yes stop_codon:yes gene_type:complete
MNESIEIIEEKYPQTAMEFKKIQAKQYELFCKKQLDYGPSNISCGTNLETDEEKNFSLSGLWFRINDKIQRLKNLLMNNQEAQNEPTEDSFMDLGVYSIMAMIVKNNKWAK